MFETFCDRIWTYTQAFRFYGLQIGARMTVIDLTGKGDLFIHSPLKPNRHMLEQINALGSVRQVVAPNCWHHLFVQKFKDSFPEAVYFGAPGLQKKKPSFEFDGDIENHKTYGWNPYLQHHVLQGCPQLNEVVFYHPSSKTLIVTDLGLHICDDHPFWTRLAFKLQGTLNTFGWTKIEKALLIKNTADFQQSIEEILKWPFEQVILCHGRPIRQQGRALFKKAFHKPR